jgi:hypothetical protein
MKTEIEAETSTQAAGNKTDRLQSAFWPVLLGLALAGLLLRVYVGRQTFIDFDEWQHLFMAGTPRWADLLFELRTNAHPPLFFLLLRRIVRLGNPALYRVISIAAGTASIIFVGLIAKKILRSPAAQLLCAAAFALSTAAIAISVEIRSYPLASSLMVAAFWAWLSIFPGSDKGGRPGVIFACCSSLALMSHYSAVLFLAACSVVPLVIAAVSPELRKQWLSPAYRRSIRRAAASLVTPWAVFTFFYFVHIRKQLMEGYVADFYRGGTPGETTAGFLMRNGRNFFNLFSPVELHSTAAFAAAMMIGCALVWILLRKSRLTYRGAAAVVFAAAVVLQLAVASLARKYPFGGSLRHQYVAGPLLLIAVFVLVDAFFLAVRPTIRRAIPILIVAGMAVNLIVGVPKLIMYPGSVLYRDEFNAWRSPFGNTRAVYLDHWSVIAFFINTSAVPRQFVRRIRSDVHIDEYQLPDGTRMFYDKTRDNLNLADASVYRSFTDCLRGSGVHELSLFFFTAGDTPLPKLPQDTEKLVTKKAAEQGLAVTRVIATKTTVNAAFRLRAN